MKYKILLDKKKRHLFKICEVKKLAFKIRLRLKEKLYNTIQLEQCVKNSCLSKLRNRCILTSRSKSVYKKLHISRIKFRELILNGLQLGFKKSSW